MELLVYHTTRRDAWLSGGPAFGCRRLPYGRDASTTLQERHLTYCLFSSSIEPQALDTLPLACIS